MLPYDRDPLAIPPLPDLTTPEDDVALVPWPQDETTRRRLAAAGLPRLLLIEPGEPPPVDTDELEDWVRLPVDPEELDARIATLARRARDLGTDGTRPVLDADGVLHRGDRWVALPPIESRLAELLLRRLGQVAHRPELVDAAWPGEVALGERALDGAVKRLRRHIAPLDLHIHRVSGRGFLLDLGG